MILELLVWFFAANKTHLISNIFYTVLCVNVTIFKLRLGASIGRFVRWLVGWSVGLSVEKS